MVDGNLVLLNSRMNCNFVAIHPAIQQHPCFHWRINYDVSRGFMESLHKAGSGV